jgi:hypothetical protein
MPHNGAEMLPVKVRLGSKSEVGGRNPEARFNPRKKTQLAHRQHVRKVQNPEVNRQLTPVTVSLRCWVLSNALKRKRPPDRGGLQ